MKSKQAIPALMREALKSRYSFIYSKAGVIPKSGFIVLIPSSIKVFNRIPNIRAIKAWLKTALSLAETQMIYYFDLMRDKKVLIGLANVVQNMDIVFGMSLFRMLPCYYKIANRGRNIEEKHL